MLDGHGYASGSLPRLYVLAISAIGETAFIYRFKLSANLGNKGSRYSNAVKTDIASSGVIKLIFDASLNR